MATFQVSEEEQFVPREIVRAFSMRIKTEYENDTDSETELRRALRENVEEEESQQKKRIREINEYLNSTRPHELAKLNQLRNALELSMQDFAARVQKGQSQDVLPRKFESWEDVTLVVESLMGRLKHKQETGKFRRATKHLRTFCNTIKAHSTALKMLPTNNDYVKVFYGALATVLQASEGYTKVMEALPRALVEINDAVAGIEKRSWLFENTTMKSYMWRIYSQIFSFLGEVIRWYTKRSIQRAISSFNEHLEEFFEDQVEEIRKLAKLVHDEADFRAQADAQINRLYLEEMDGKFDRFINELRERDAAQRSILNRRYDRFHEALETKQRNELFDPQVLGNKLLDLCNRLRQQDTGSAVRDILEEDARKQLPWSGDMANPHRAQNDDMLVLSQGFVSRTVTQSDGGIPPAPKATRDAILLNSAQLEDYFDRAQLVIPGSSENNATFAEPDVADRIRSWIVATDSQILYTSGTDPFGEHLQNSSTVGQYATIIREAGLPMCSYSCLLKNETPPPGRTQETIELVALVCSLIRQLIEILPPVIEPGSALIQGFRWDELDGSLRTFPLAFEILEVLLNSTKHAVVIIIIDAIDLLEDPSYKSTEKWLTRLVQLFVKLSKTSQSTVFKIWFNSGGMSQTLFQILEPHQIALSSSSKKPGRQTFGSEFIMF